MLPDIPTDPPDYEGTVGYTESSPEGDLDRAKVMVDGEQYIIQNNNWLDPEGTDLILEYLNNSFQIVEGTGVGSEDNPASFPSIYIGANGETDQGVWATSDTDNLPIQVSQISGIETSFTWSGTTSAFTAGYNVWLANSPPTSTYFDGIDGFVDIWVHDPRDYQPPGDDQGDADIAGVLWDVWVGPRGDGPDGYNPAPVVTFVAREDIPSMTFDIRDFISHAEAYGIDSAMYVTDIHFGFEIWNGGAGGGLGVDEFTCRVE